MTPAEIDEQVAAFRDEVEAVGGVAIPPVPRRHRRGPVALGVLGGVGTFAAACMHPAAPLVAGAVFLGVYAAAVAREGS